MLKEFIQMKRDKTTFAMIIVVPLMQLILFGYAINLNPRHLPTVVVGDANTPTARKIISAMEQSSYFDIEKPSVSESTSNKWLQTGKVQFSLNFPSNFSRDLIKGYKPQLLLQVDATDPAATSQAVSVFRELPHFIFADESFGPLQHLVFDNTTYEPIVHSLYNPLAVTAFNIVPGLLGVVLSMTMVTVTAMAITREYERGTVENLLAMPIKPLEVMTGKILPYIIVGYIQVLLILIFAKFLFDVPMQGSVTLLLLFCLPFIAANLAMGLTFSTIASNQLQAVQSSFFFFLPSILLSGFMFPFRGMPEWAQFLGNLLPLKHFLIIVRGILLKGNGFFEVWPEVLPILGFLFVVMLISFKRYRKTLD